MELSTSPTNTPLISPSILNCDFSQLGVELGKIASADFTHLDIMDNHFVPNLALGTPIAQAVIAHSPIPVDAHLMIENPDVWALDYADMGCASVTFHVEAAQAPVRLARELHKRSVRASLGIRPATGVDSFINIVDEFDQILIMTVEPGFGGQSFLEGMLEKIRATRKVISERNLDIAIQVDGGISQATIEKAAQAGATNFVAGSAIYRAEDAYEEISTLRELASKHIHH